MVHDMSEMVLPGAVLVSGGVDVDGSTLWVEVAGQSLASLLQHLLIRQVAETTRSQGLMAHLRHLTFARNSTSIKMRKGLGRTLPPPGHPPMDRPPHFDVHSLLLIGSGGSHDFSVRRKCPPLKLPPHFYLHSLSLVGCCYSLEEGAFCRALEEE